MKNSRRNFIKQTTLTSAGIGLLGLSACTSDSSDANKASSDKLKEAAKKAVSPLFKLSLAQWSLHKTHFDGKMTALDFAQAAKKEFGVNAIEYVNQFFKDQAENKTYLGDLKTRAEGEGVKSLLIMIDGEGALGDLDEKVRTTAVENHYKWVDAAKFLGCHSIRVNASGEGAAEDVSTAVVDGLSRLATFAKDYDINIIVENHGGYSSDGQWLSGVMKNINMGNCGTLPDFGNFCVEFDDPKNYATRKCINDYDRYKGVAELMPYAKAVSAKSHDFDANGNEIHTDFKKMMKIVLAAGYNSYVGIEYEGKELSEFDGIKATKALLDRTHQELITG